MNDTEIASMLIHGASDKRKSTPTTTTTTTTITGMAESESSAGRVYVRISGQEIGGNIVSIPCIGKISKGDTVIISVTGAAGRAKSLIATGSIGSGDSAAAATEAQLSSIAVQASSLTSDIAVINAQASKIASDMNAVSEKLDSVTSEASNPQLAVFASLLAPTIAPSLSVSQLVSINTLLPTWSSGTNYKRGEAVIYNGDIYRIAQAHTSQSLWLPPSAPSLYTRIKLAVDGIRIWVAPTNAEDSFSNGEKAHYPDGNGDIWVSKRDGNTSVPGTDSWWIKEEAE